MRGWLIVGGGEEEENGKEESKRTRETIRGRSKRRSAAYRHEKPREKSRTVDAARSFGIDGLIPFLDPLSPFFLVRAYPDPIDISLHCRDSSRAGGVTDASLCSNDVNHTYTLKKGRGMKRKKRKR